jgi:RNA polymerase sigma-70 factor (ECF subfamily)
MHQNFASDLEQEVVRNYELYAAALLRYGRSLAPNEDGAKDAVQETFLRYFMERRYGRQIANPRAWLYLVLRNFLFERFKKEQKYETAVESLDHVPDHQENPEGRLYREALARELTDALTERERECLRLRMNGLGYAEIAEVLGICAGTVGALLTRAQGKMRRMAGDQQADRLEAAHAISALLDEGMAYSS